MTELEARLMLMLALASAENMVAATPLRLAICRPTAASTQQSFILSTLLMRPARMASANLPQDEHSFTPHSRQRSN